MEIRCHSPNIFYHCSGNMWDKEMNSGYLTFDLSRTFWHLGNFQVGSVHWLIYHVCTGKKCHTFERLSMNELVSIFCGRCNFQKVASLRFLTPLFIYNFFTRITWSLWWLSLSKSIRKFLNPPQKWKFEEKKTTKLWNLMTTVKHV